jgi:four helix bundle protein
MLSKSNPLYVKSDMLARNVYDVLTSFPKYELYGLSSQLRRSALSVVLNIVEGFARQGPNEFRRFLIISFGSLEETRYLLEFSLRQKYLDELKFNQLINNVDEVARILWSIIHSKQ